MLESPAEKREQMANLEGGIDHFGSQDAEVGPLLKTFKTNHVSVRPHVSVAQFVP